MKQKKNRKRIDSEQKTGQEGMSAVAHSTSAKGNDKSEEQSKMNEIRAQLTSLRPLVGEIGGKGPRTKLTQRVLFNALLDLAEKKSLETTSRVDSETGKITIQIRYDNLVAYLVEKKNIKGPEKKNTLFTAETMPLIHPMVLNLNHSLEKLHANVFIKRHGDRYLFIITPRTQAATERFDETVGKEPTGAAVAGTSRKTKNKKKEYSDKCRRVIAPQNRDFFLTGCGIGNYISLLPVPPGRVDVTGLDEFIDTIDRIVGEKHEAVSPIVEARDKLTSANSVSLGDDIVKLIIERFLDSVKHIPELVRANSSTDQFRWFLLGQLIYDIPTSAVTNPREFPDKSKLAALSFLVEEMNLPSRLREDIFGFLRRVRELTSEEAKSTMEAVNRISKVVYLLL